MTEAVIVVGASGFVGRNLMARLAGRVGRLVAVVGTSGAVPGADETVRFADLSSVEALPADTVVVQLAAQRYDAGRFDLAQSDLLTNNTDIANAVYRFCLERGLKEVRLASTVAVYPAGSDTLDDDVPIDLNAPPNPNEAFYAWSKRFAEIAAGLYRDRFGINTIAFRLSNPYGPHDSRDIKAAHVLPAFVMRALAESGPFAIRGNPLVERDFTYVGDVVDIFERSLAMRGVNERMNLCRGETTTLLGLAQAILAVAGLDRPVLAPDTATAGVLARRSTNARLRRVFGDHRFATLDEGLRPTVAWYRDAVG